MVVSLWEGFRKNAKDNRPPAVAGACKPQRPAGRLLAAHLGRLLWAWRKAGLQSDLSWTIEDLHDR